MAPKHLASDWQLRCVSMKDRGLQLLQSWQWADCWFMVGSGRKRQAAHKLILATASAVFETMLYGAFAEKPEQIVVPDMEPDAFYIMLEYIYTDCLNIGSCSVAREVYYGAHKYTLPHLKKACVAYLSNHLDPVNVLKTYELARLYREEMLIEECLQMMKESTTEVLEATGFLDAKEGTVKQLFMLEPLQIKSEMQLFEAAERYVLARRRRRSSVEDDDDIPIENTGQLPLRSVVQQIRFLTLTLKEFSGHPTLTSLLADNEVLAIVKNLTSMDSTEPMPSGFSFSRMSRTQVESRTEVTARIVVDLNTTTQETWFSTIKQTEFRSSTFYARNLPWRLVVLRSGDWLTVRPNCNWEVKSGWSCQAEVELNLLSYTRPDVTPFYWKYNRLFSPAVNDWGISCFIRWSTLMDPVNGYVQDNKIIIEVRIKTVST